MRRRQVKESLYKTVRYKYPDLDAAATKIQTAYRGHLARKELAIRKRQKQARESGARRRVDPSPSSDWPSDAESDPVPPRPLRPAATGRPTRPGGKRGVHRPYLAARPATSSSSSEGYWGEDLSYSRRHPGHKSRGSQTAPTKTPSTIPYGKTPLSRKSAAAEMPQEDDGDINLLEDTNSPERWNQRGGDIAAAETDKQWFEDQNGTRRAPRRGHFSRGAVVTRLPRGFASQPRGVYGRRTASNQQANQQQMECDRERRPVVNLARATPDGGRRSSGRHLSSACQEQCAGSYTCSSETVCEEYKYTNRGPAFKERNISNECLPPSGNTEREVYNDVDHVYRERRMAHRAAQKLPIDGSSCEYRLEYLRHRAAINLPDDHGRTERWVSRHFHIMPGHIHAETADDTVIVCDNSVSPYSGDIPPFGTRAQHSKKTAPRERGDILKQKIISTAGTFVYSSSEDTSPPLERRRIRFTPSTASPKNRRARRSYRDIIREEEMRARNFSMERKPLAKADRQLAETGAPYNQGGYWKKTVEFRDTHEYSITGRRTSDAILNLEDEEDGPVADPPNVPYQPRKQNFGYCPRTNHNSFPQGPPHKKEIQFRRTSCSLTGQREIGIHRPDKSRHVACGGNSLYVATRDEVGKGDPGSSDDKKLASTKARNRSAVFESTSAENAVSDDTTTQFYSCPQTLKQVSDRSQTLESDPSQNWWSPISDLLPPLPHKSAAEGCEILGSIRGAWLYTDDMAKVPKLQNGSCHSLAVIGGISVHRPTDYLDGKEYFHLSPNWREAISCLTRARLNE